MEQREAIAIQIIDMDVREDDVIYSYYNSFNAEDEPVRSSYLFGAKLFKNRACKNLKSVQEKLVAQGVKCRTIRIDHLPF